MGPEGALRARLGGVVPGWALVAACAGQRHAERGQVARGGTEGDFQAAVMQRTGIGHVARRHQGAQGQGQKRQPQHPVGARGASQAVEAGQVRHRAILVMPAGQSPASRRRTRAI
ncbi:hypothetical protein G6F24_017492 [Rhizopus arrhizus]|nr:hypothetical protein G6F24_017492 [Rhizopus arrhizus]